MHYYVKSNILTEPSINGVNFSGYASVFNVIDKQNDIIINGAFKNSINKFGSKYTSLLLGHNDQDRVGQITQLEEDNYGLFIGGFIDTALPKSKGLLELIKNRQILNFSIGYYIINCYKISNITYITDLDLIEISFVKFPANQEAKIITVNGLYINDEILS